jgi:2'-hydroxyisoflavone reductase
VACEQAVERVFPGRTLIIRPGIVAGPFDPTNRFTWWVERLARAGEVLGPGAPDSPVQLVDGRDLGAFTVSLTERQESGSFNVCGHPSSFGELIDACRAGTGTGPEVTWVSEEVLLAHDVEPFTEMPLWLPEEPGNRAFYSMSNARARAQGLELRHLADTARDTWEWLRAVRAGELPEPIAGGFVARGLSPAHEAALLAASR